MTSTKDPVFVPGIWGPYFSAMVPGLWLNEGGQSAAGAAIDQLLSLHPAAHEAQITAKAQGVSLPELLATKLAAVCKDPPDAVNFVGKLHVVPEFLGNRSPFADPHARAIISGLDMANDLNSLISHYVAGICGLGYGLRQIIETQGANGVHINSIVISGGAGKHPIVRQLIADATGVTVVGTSSDEPVLLGAAMLGAVASGLFPEITDAMQAMSGQSGDHKPTTGKIRDRHEDRFRVFELLQQTAQQIRALP
jgi:D-ribulokinase